MLFCLNYFLVLFQHLNYNIYNYRIIVVHFDVFFTSECRTRCTVVVKKGGIIWLI